MWRDPHVLIQKQKLMALMSWIHLLGEPFCSQKVTSHRLQIRFKPIKAI